jgi:hypothetical protein
MSHRLHLYTTTSYQPISSHSLIKIIYPWRDYTVRGQSNVWRLPVWRLPKSPTPSRPDECIPPPPPPCGAGGGHTRWVERGLGVNSSEDARHCSVLYVCKYFVNLPFFLYCNQLLVLRAGLQKLGMQSTFFSLSQLSHIHFIIPHNIPGHLALGRKPCQWPLVYIHYFFLLCLLPCSLTKIMPLLNSTS